MLTLLIYMDLWSSIQSIKQLNSTSLQVEPYPFLLHFFFVVLLFGFCGWWTRELRRVPRSEL